MHIAVVTYNWPPRNAIGTHRPYSWAKYWSRSGVKVTVLTARKQAFDEPLDLRFPLLPEVDVQEIQFGGSSARFAPALSGIATALKSVKRMLRSRFGFVLDPRDAWANKAKYSSLMLADKVDVVVSTFGPRSSHIIASNMKRHNPGLLWIADYRDLWSNSHLAGYSARERRKQQALEEATVGARADVITTVSDEMAEQQREFLRKPVWVIPNGFDTEVAPPEDAGPASGCSRIVYTGMIYRGHRDPTPLFIALKELLVEGRINAGSIRVEFYGPLERWLEEAIVSFGLESLVDVHGRVSRDVCLAQQREADLLLLLESGAAEAAGVLTGKLFEYLAAGRPILSLGSRQGFSICRVLGECGAGVCAEDNVALIKDLLLDLIARKPFPWFNPDANAIGRYSRETQAKHLLALIEDRRAAGDSQFLGGCEK